MKLNSKFGLSLVLAALCVSNAGWAKEDQKKLNKRVNSSAKALETMGRIPDKFVKPELMKLVKCMAIIPNYRKGGLFAIGAEGGKGVASCVQQVSAGIIDNNADHGTLEMSYPAFVNLAGGGIEANVFLGGYEQGDLFIAFANESAPERLGNTALQLGVSAGLTVGLGRGVGAGIDSKLNSYVSYYRSKGFHISAGLSGAVLQSNETANETFYANGTKFRIGTSDKGEDVNLSKKGEGRLAHQLLTHVPSLGDDVPGSEKEDSAIGRLMGDLKTIVLEPIADARAADKTPIKTDPTEPPADDEVKPVRARRVNN